MFKSRATKLNKPSTGWFGRLVEAIESRPASDRLIGRVLFFTVIAGLAFSILAVSDKYLATTPVPGGVLIEGVVGIPRFVNPVLAVTRADQDVSALLYAGLMKIDPEGNLVPNLAESVTVSDDGLTYNVVMRRDVRFHDGTPLTARDVAFTIGLIQNADLKSPLRGNWMGVTIEELGEYELNIIVDEAYTPFIENFTVGILPRHIWSELQVAEIPFSPKNTEPVGAGPFAIKSVVRNDGGLIKSYSLKRAESGASVPKLEGMTIRFYQNEADLFADVEAGLITSTASLEASQVTTIETAGGYQVIEEPLPRVFGVFFNQNRSLVLRDPAVREALGIAIDRTALVQDVLYGHGVPISTPIPPRLGAVDSERNLIASASTTLATDILIDAGWSKNQDGIFEKRIDGQTVPLRLTIRTANSDLFAQTAEHLESTWREIGIEVTIEQFEQSDLLQTVIRERDFEALLFGIDMNRAVDLYPFWHSSQREDPGLNIAQYANIEVDTLLRTARTSKDPLARITAETAALEILEKERPAIFLYVPTLTYVIKEGVTTSQITGISRPYERLMNVDTWYMTADELWPWFR
jgi:peptide/nickel transport system substrate-binding protein